MIANIKDKIWNKRCWINLEHYECVHQVSAYSQNINHCMNTLLHEPIYENKSAVAIDLLWNYAMW